MSETWHDFFRRKLEEWDDKYSEDEKLLDALNDIMEEHQ